MQDREKFLIFVVDDEEIIASSIAAILCLNGLDAIAFTRSSEALAYSRTAAPDLLICDVMMPGLSGAALAQLIQASLSGVQSPVIHWTVGFRRYRDYCVRKRTGLSADPETGSPQRTAEKSSRNVGHYSVESVRREDRARRRTAENMKETVAAVQADIQITTARKRSARRRAEHKG